jgi:hypothetical protein
METVSNSTICWIGITEVNAQAFEMKTVRKTYGPRKKEAGDYEQIWR